MTEFFYRFEGLNLMPGSKTAGFVALISTDALQKLRTVTVSDPEYQGLVMQARERLARAGLLPKKVLARCGIALVDRTACPLLFTTDPMVGGSIGANPDELEQVQASDVLERLGDAIWYTPHNVDSPAQALALMVLFETWAEWARGKLLAVEQARASHPKWEPLANDDCHLTLAQFKEYEDNGSLTSDDGDGCYATATEVSDVSVRCCAPDWATHVVWYNR